jgi:hypothetical protein
MKPFNIRNADFDVVAQARGLKEVLMMLPDLERIDVWASKSTSWLKPGASKACQIGLCWANGSTAIFDFPDIVEASKIFSEAIEAGKPAPIFHVKESGK